MSLPPATTTRPPAIPPGGDGLRAFGAIGATVLTLIVLGHDGRRVAQLMVLALPVLAWLAWPVRRPWLHRLRTVLTWLWAMGFAFDGVARAYLKETYQAAPDASIVLGAVANTNPRESAEYLAMHWRSALLWFGALALAGAVIARQAPRQVPAGPPRRPSRWVLGLVGLALLTGSLAYASKPWRRLHPVLFWTHWSQSVQTLQAGWADQQRVRDAALASGRAAAPRLLQAGPSTVVLVLTDSVNRDNLSLYGYGRPTTPLLQAQQAALAQQMLVLRHAWSVDASTLPALRNLFNFGLPAQEAPPHLLALARAAGYKVWWISNHDDVAIEQQHAKLADVVDMVNRTPGRAGASLDSELLDCVQEALEDTGAERKLIVVHLLGAHPHYKLRFPAGANPFGDRVDAVESGLALQGRSSWVRQFRQQYDAALLYHDAVVSTLLDLTRNAGRPGAHSAWMYLSDHGQEVGHGSDRAGHSPSTASGYRIPAVLWRSPNGPPLPADAAALPFRADWAGWTLTDLLQLEWDGQQPERNVLDPRYRWQAPQLPAPVASFTD